MCKLVTRCTPLYTVSLVFSNLVIVVSFSVTCTSLVLVYLLGIMHQSFVITAIVPTGLGNSGDIDFPLCKARVYVQQHGNISMVKALLKSRQAILK